MNWKEKLAQLYREARALADKSDKDGLSDAETKRWDELKSEIAEAKGKVAEEEQRAADAKAFRDGDTEYNKGTGSAARTVTGQMRKDAEQGNGETRQRQDRSVAGRFLASDAWKRFREEHGAAGTRTQPVEVGSFFHRDSQPIDVTGWSAEELRTLIYTGALPSSPAFIAPNRLPGIYTPDLPDLTVRSAFLNLQTASPAIQFFVENVFTNNAAFVAEASATSDTSGTKAESALTYTSDSVMAQTLAHWIPVTNQMLEDEPQMRGIIEGRLLDGLRLAEDAAILSGDGNSPNIKGLENVSGTQAADAAYFAANPVEGASEKWEDFDRITRARRLVRQVGRARASFVLLSPADVERLITITDTNGQYFSGSPFADSALASMRGLRIIETEELEEGEAWVGDGRMAAVFDRMAATVTAGWIDKQFIRNMMTLLAEERLAFAVFRPAAFVKVDLTSAS